MASPGAIYILQHIRLHQWPVEKFYRSLRSFSITFYISMIHQSQYIPINTWGSHCSLLQPFVVLIIVSRLILNVGKCWLLNLPVALKYSRSSNNLPDLYGCQWARHIIFLNEAWHYCLHVWERSMRQDYKDHKYKGQMCSCALWLTSSKNTHTHQLNKSSTCIKNMERR